MQPLQENHTYELVKFPKGRKALKNKWLYKLKLDVKTTFLHGDLEEEIYMEQSKGLSVKGEVVSWQPRLQKTVASSMTKAEYMEFEDVFPEEVPNGLPPISGIEHQIDFILGASVPNCLAYRSNPDETKELQKQVEELMEKG
ncbi:hypothetical protein L6164_002594 [Bauhinia variegata]|uniref:Uncharacterized protein n=1 Tax=Bauhinia variegata TaxID=167791 RepID=A0ACB9PYJ5_BAUVA|nr:hypothetical protein L6164_002594 [Bauhinia variegata]